MNSKYSFSGELTLKNQSLGTVKDCEVMILKVKGVIFAALVLSNGFANIIIVFKQVFQTTPFCLRS